MQFHANFTQFSRNLDYFSHFWVNFNMLGIKKHILKLRNSLVVLGETIGLKKGPKPQRRGRRPPNGAKGPLKPSTGARIRGVWAPLSSSHLYYRSLYCSYYWLSILNIAKYS